MACTHPDSMKFERRAVIRGYPSKWMQCRECDRLRNRKYRARTNSLQDAFHKLATQKWA